MEPLESNSSISASAGNFSRTSQFHWTENRTDHISKKEDNTDLNQHYVNKRCHQLSDISYGYDIIRGRAPKSAPLNQCAPHPLPASG